MLRPYDAAVPKSQRKGLLVAFLVAVFAQTEGVWALQINVGTVQPFPQPDTDSSGYSAYQWCFGMQAAFDEANTKQLLGADVTVQLTVRAAYSAGDPRNKLLVDDLLQNANVSLLAGTSVEATSEALSASQRAGAPLFGAYASDPTSLYTSSSRVAVNYRAPDSEELWQMFNIALNSKLRCKRFGIVYYYADGFDGLAAALRKRLNDWGHTEVTLGPYGLTNDSYVMWNTSVRAILSNRPHCVFFLGKHTVQDFMIAVMDHWNLDLGFDSKDLAFISSSTGNSRVWRDARLWNRVFVVQQVPPPQDTTFEVVRRYQAAIDAFAAKGYYDPPGKGFSLPAGYGNDSAPNYVSLQGYLVGRLVVEVLGRATHNNFSWSNILDIVYRQKMFQLDDVLLGPYMDGCIGRLNQTKLPCFANSGSKMLYTSYLAPDGTLRPYTAALSPYMEDLTVSQLPLPATAHTDSAVGVRTPTLFVSVVELSWLLPRPSQLQASVQYQTYFSAALLSFQFLGIAAALAGNLVAQIEGTLSMDAEALRQYIDRYPLMGFAGGVQVSELNVSGYFATSGYDGGQYRLTDPPLSDWREENIALEPVLADYVHALAAKVADDSARSGATPQVTILASSDAEVELAAKSLHTFQLTFDEPMVVAGYSGSASAQLYLYQDLRARLTSGMDSGCRVLFLVSQTTAFVDSVLKLVLAEMPRLLVFIATSEEVLEASLNGMTAAERSGFDASRHNIFFSSVFTPFFHRAGYFALPDTLAEAYESLLPQVPNSMFSFAGLRGFRIGFYLYSAQSIIANIVSPSRYLTVWYDQGTIPAVEQQVGRFYRQQCLPSVVAANAVDRACQCSKGPRTFNVHSLTDWALGVPTNQTNVSFRYTHTFCGTYYIPLTMPSSSSTLTAILAGSLGGGALAVLVLAAALVISRPTRDNRCAPRAPASPFTILFTDIQSSTALWARCPQQMAEAVETHHRLIRKLIRTHKAYEVKTVGDSFMIACANADAAVELALGLQESFFEHDWRTGIFDETYAVLERLGAPSDGILPLIPDNGSSSFDGGLQLLRRDGDSSPSAANPLGVVPGNVDFRTVAEAGSPSYDGVEATCNPSPRATTDRDVRTAKIKPSGTFWNGLRVRVGIHTGLGEIKHDPVSLGYDYYGTVVNTAARVEGVGHGGQILLTEATFEAARGPHRDYKVFEKAIVTCLGPQPLRGLDQPVVLYQLVPERLRGRTFRALRLDVENDVETEPSRLSEPNSSAPWAVSADGMAYRLARRTAGENFQSMYAELLHTHAFLSHVLSPCAERERRQLLKSISQRWQVLPSSHCSYDEQLMSLVAKTYLSFEAKHRLRKGARRESDASTRMATAYGAYSSNPASPGPGQQSLVASIEGLSRSVSPATEPAAPLP